MELNIHRLRVATNCRNANRGGGNSNGLIFQNFSGFIYHLHFFFGVPVVEKGINMR